MLLLFLSPFGRQLIRHKYDAFTTDRAYSTRPSGYFGLDMFLDWIVLRQSLHAGLRQRLDIVVPNSRD